VRKWVADETATASDVTGKIAAFDPISRYIMITGRGISRIGHWRWHHGCYYSSFPAYQDDDYGYNDYYGNKRLRETGDCA
jgi:hypothetical protein